MSVAVTINSAAALNPAAGIGSNQNELIVSGALTLSGNYGGASTHGDMMNLGTFDKIKSQQPPEKVEVYQEPTAGNAPVIYLFLYGRGTTQANGVLIVTDFAGVEITEGAAYPAALTDPTANLRFRAYFPSFI